MHRLLAFFEGTSGIRRITQHRDGARQCEAKGGGTEKGPAAKFQRRLKPQFGSFPQAAPSTTGGDGPVLARDDSVIDPYENGNCADVCRP
jgi:hypothetical protein